MLWLPPPFRIDWDPSFATWLREPIRTIPVFLSAICPTNPEHPLIFQDSNCVIFLEVDDEASEAQATQIWYSPLVRLVNRCVICLAFFFIWYQSSVKETNILLVWLEIHLHLTLQIKSLQSWFLKKHSQKPEARSHSSYSTCWKGHGKASKVNKSCSTNELVAREIPPQIILKLEHAASATVPFIHAWIKSCLHKSRSCKCEVVDVLQGVSCIIVCISNLGLWSSPKILWW